MPSFIIFSSTVINWIRIICGKSLSGQYHMPLIKRILLQLFHQYRSPARKTQLLYRQKMVLSLSNISKYCLSYWLLPQYLLSFSSDNLSTASWAGGNSWNFSFFLPEKMVNFSYPRKPRLDAPGVVQHVIAQRIEIRKILLDEKDYQFLKDRLGKLILETRMERDWEGIIGAGMGGWGGKKFSGRRLVRCWNILTRGSRRPARYGQFMEEGSLQGKRDDPIPNLILFNTLLQLPDPGPLCAPDTSWSSELYSTFVDFTMPGTS